MSNEGVTLIWRVALVVVAIIANAFFRALVGPSKRRSFYMGVGTVGGIAAGVAAASLLFSWGRTDVSPSIFAFVGMIAGWAVAWRFARQIPRETC
jgi:CHASE2 domain-containing sensor protein